MHITVPRTSFLQHVQRCQNIVEKRSTNAILSNLLLQTSGQKLRIVATDLQIGVCSEVEANIQSEGSVTISAKKLFDIVINTLIYEMVALCSLFNCNQFLIT